MMSDKVVHIKDAEFDQAVLKSDIPVIVDFWAPWCGPCHMIAPVVEELAGEYEGKVKVSKINVDENPRTAAKYGIRSIPTILFFKEGKVLDQVIGAVSKDELVKKLSGAL
jgi:thioredoxin 1